MNPQSAQQPDPLIEELRKDLQQVISQRFDEEVKTEKHRQHLRLDKVDNYLRGNPYVAANYDAGTGQMGWSSVSGKDDQGIYDYNIDITKSYQRKYVGVLGTRPFYNVKSVPDNPSRDEDRKASRQGDLLAIFLNAKWDIRVRNIEVFSYQYKAGTAYGLIDHIADKALWGETTEPIFEPKTVELEPAGFRCTSCGTKSPEPQTVESFDELTGEPIQDTACPACGAPLSEIHAEPAQTAEVPEQVGSKTYPNAGPRLTLTTGLTTTVPFDTKSMETCQRLRYEYEEHPGVLLQLYREQLKDKLDDKGDLKPLDESETTERGRRSREYAASLTGQSTSEVGKARWTYSQDWLMPSNYEYVQDEKKRATLYENFPSGLRIARVGGHIVKLTDEAITDSWMAFEPEPGEYLYKDPMCWGILGQQDLTNDAWNLMIAILESVKASGFYDPDVIDGEAFANSGLNDWLPAKAGTSGRLEHALAKSPSSSFPDHAFPMLAGVEANVQSHLGLLPAVWGGGEKSSTAEETRTRLNQALMQLAVQGEYAGRGWKRVREIAANKVKKFGLTAGAIPTGKETAELFDLEALRGGNFHFENEPGVPMSFSERRDQMNLIIGQNPELAHALGIDSPTNLPVVRDYLLSGMDELQSPGEDRKQKVMEVIRELLKQNPIGDQPSILPEPFVDDPADASYVLDWLRSEAGRLEAKQNPLGRQNVIAYGVSMNMLPMPMGTPPMMPPPEEGGGGGKPPKSAGPPPPQSGGGMPPAAGQI